MVFDTHWFEQHQSKLLWLLSHWSTRKLMRWVLRIRPCDVGYAKDIVALMPHAYTVGNADGTLTTDFRTHAKYAKRLYHALKPLWWAMHAWDWAVADRWVPAWSAGFSTLTAYPDPDPETATFDGHPVRVGVAESWATLIAGAGNGSNDSSTTINPFRTASDSTTDVWSQLYRAIFLFDTSAITSGGTVSAAVLSLYGTAKQDNLSISPDLDIYTSTPASNTALANGDFSQIGATSQTGSPLAYASYSTTGYNDFTFNSTGRSNVNTTGISKFGTRNANYDVAAVAPTWSSLVTSSFTCSSADETGTTQDPKLVVTYTPLRLWFFGAH